MQEAADKLAAYAGYSGKRAARDAAAPDAWDAEEAPDSEVELCFGPSTQCQLSLSHSHGTSCKRSMHMPSSMCWLSAQIGFQHWSDESRRFGSC